MPITGNKGEWSEIYTLFKLLGDGRVFAGDGNMQIINNLYYPIIRVIRQEAQKYLYEPNKTGQMVYVLDDNKNVLLQLSMSRFTQVANQLFSQIKSARGPSFSFPNIETFMSSVYCSKLKADSQDKTDIRIVIHDLRTGLMPELGFSIKSQLGHPSTLLNPGATTNFVYRIVGKLSSSDITRINGIKGQIDRMNELFKTVDIKYKSMDCETFEDNLMIVDSLMPEIVAECIKEHFVSGNSDLKSITNEIIKRNPLGVRKPKAFYTAKVKSLLIDSALGMTPATVWTRYYDANGGYLVVRDDGEVVCYHFYDRNQLEDYLFNNTRLDFPSRTRYHYGSLYTSGKDVLIKLNLQIRFK